MKKLISTIVLTAVLASSALAAKVKIPMYLVLKGDNHKFIGNVTAVDTNFGLLLTPRLHNLPAGIHGFHVHVNPSCKNNGEAAGGHLDPTGSNRHLGPYNISGHLGDLPVLIVAKNGWATLPVLAPRLKVKDILNHSLMIHEGGDNYSDIPAKLGGGGPRLACGVIK